ATLLPPIYRSRDDLEGWRRRLSERIERLHDANVRIDLARQPSAPLFFLAYQGQNDRALQAAYAQLHKPPAVTAPLPRRQSGERIDIGFVSGDFRTHTIGELTRGLIAQLDRQAFMVTV